VVLHLSSPDGLFIYSSCGKHPFPLLQWSVPHTTTFTKFPTPGCWADAATPAFFSRLVYLQFLWEVPLPCSPVEFSSHCHFYKISCSKIAGQVQPLLPSLIGIAPSPLFGAQGTPSSLLHVFFLLLLFSLFSFSFFPGWESVYPRGYVDLAQGLL
jgi:hypothetical protein